MKNMILIPQTTYIYRVKHRIMEGDCQYDHGPRPVTAGPIMAFRYPVTNAQYYKFIQESCYVPEDSSNYLLHWKNGIYLPGEEDHPVVYVSRMLPRTLISMAAGCLLIMNGS